MTNNHKVYKTLDEQVSILVSRGLFISDKEYAKQKLSSLNYYRLSGYWLTLQKNDTFNKGTSFEDIIDIYDFDKKLKLHILKWLSDIEIELRSHIGYILGEKDNDSTSEIFSYQDKNNFMDGFFDNIQKSIYEAISDCKDEAFVKHHKNKYGGKFPAWVLVEILSFGKLSKFFDALQPDIKEKIVSNFYPALRKQTLSNYLQGLVILRNTCAHHSRIYNRGLTHKPIFSTQEKAYLEQHSYEKNEIGSKVFFKLVSLIRVSGKEETLIDVIKTIKELHSQFPSVILKHYGFKNNWETILKDMTKNYLYK